MDRTILHHIPVCPFSQRIEILLALKESPDAVRFEVADITRPRDPRLLQLSRGSTALPILETGRGVLKESLVILGWADATIGAPVARADPFEHAVESMLIALEGGFTGAGYGFLMNQDPAARDGFRARMDAEFAALDDQLRWRNPEGTWLFDRFGLAETVFTPLFARFRFLDYYEDYAIPAGLDRVRRWHAACLAHPAAQQVGAEEVIKSYYDYTRGAANGALPEGRTVSSFSFEPPWSARPMPPRDKYRPGATDADLGLV